jgi:hypothetical protein
MVAKDKHTSLFSLLVIGEEKKRVLYHLTPEGRPASAWIRTGRTPRSGPHGQEAKFNQRTPQFTNRFLRGRLAEVGGQPGRLGSPRKSGHDGAEAADPGVNPIKLFTVVSYPFS